jgi:phenylacetic acid degradation protein paaN
MNIDQLIKANHSRNYFSFYNENPKSYDENQMNLGLETFQKQLNNNFYISNISAIEFEGEEVSPYMMTGLGIHYPKINVSTLLENASSTLESWKNISIDIKLSILQNSLENVKERFFELAFATMHTTGQSFLMSFQASGPHACDRALEVLASAYEQLNYYPKNVQWVKDFGKFDLKLQKNYKSIPKGVSLVIGCSTFPTWNSVPGIYASLITGNPVIVKPHPKAVYPIAIFVDEIRKELIKNGLSADIIQLGVDTTANPITKLLAESDIVKLIDYTGGNEFGDYIESIGKICFTEKAGINSVIIESCTDFNKVAQNLAFSMSLYSGQMCTAPQNIYISKDGVKTEDGHLTYDDCIQKIKDAFSQLLNNPKAASPTLGAVQNENTLNRVLNTLKNNNANVIQFDANVINEEFPDARIVKPILVEVSSNQSSDFEKECFGPISFIIKTSSLEESLDLASNSALKYGAITCLAYSRDKEIMQLIEDKMNSVYTPVSFNFVGAAFVNQHTAFSDLHVSGGNPSGNATFTTTEFINKRYTWIGNRYML